MNWFKKLCSVKFANQSNKKTLKYSSNNNNSNKTGNNCVKATQAKSENIKKIERYGYSRSCDSISNLCCNSECNCNIDCCLLNDNHDCNHDCIKYCENVKSNKKLLNNNCLKADLLCEQAKKLENLISTERVFVDPDDFFEDPNEVSLYREEISILSEWIVIDLIVTTTTTTPKTKLLPTKSSHENLHKSFGSFEFLNRPPSIISLNSFDEDDFGLFYSCRGTYDIPEADYCSPLKYDRIENGKKISKKSNLPISLDINSNITSGTSTTASSNSTTSTPSKTTFSKGRKLFHKTNSETDAIARSLMGPLLKENDFCPLFNSSFTQQESKHSHERKLKNFSIQKYFGLNDDGDIIIHLNHINEYEGFGFLSKKKLKNVPYGIEAKEKPICTFGFSVLNKFFKG